jgi:hypothetical protein
MPALSLHESDHGAATPQAAQNAQKRQFVQWKREVCAERLEKPFRV